VVGITKMNPKDHQFNASRRERAAAQRRRYGIRNLMVIGGVFLILAAILFTSFSKSTGFNVAPARVGSGLGDFS
jgi:hypothetical protein